MKLFDTFIFSIYPPEEGEKRERNLQYFNFSFYLNMLYNVQSLL